MATKSTTYPTPQIVDRSAWQSELDQLLVREKAHTREGDAIAAARRRLPMVEVDAATPLVGADGEVPLIDVFEGRRQLIVYFHMWHEGKSAAEQCEGCTFFTGHAQELSYLHSRDVTYATFCQGPYAESARYRDFMGWEMPWYSAHDARDELMAGRAFRLLCVLFARRRPRLRDVLDDGSRHGGRRQQLSPAGPDRVRQAGDLGGLTRGLAAADRPQRRRSVPHRGRPTSQWSRVAAGRSDDLTG